MLSHHHFEVLPLPPCQYLLCLVGQDGAVCFDHDSKGRHDSSLQQPFHSLLNKVLLVLRRCKSDYINCVRVHLLLYIRQIIYCGLLLVCSHFFYLGVSLRHMLL